LSRASDVSSEMPGELPLDDALAPFAEEVRFAVSGPPPPPSMALAEVLEAGFSHPSDKGDLPATAGSNVHGPAPQAAGLPKWKEERDMPVTGVLAGLLAKLSGVGTAAKVAMAGATAVATMGLAGGAAGVLPAPAQDVVAAAVNAATPFEFPDGGGVTGVIDHAVGALPPVEVAVPPVEAGVTVPAQPSGAVGAGASGKVSASVPPPPDPAAIVAPAMPGVTVPSLPQLTVPPAVANLVKGLPACVTNLIPAGGGVPDPARLATQIPACIPQVLNTANLPPEVARCVSSILGAIGGANGMSPGSVAGVGALNVSSCVPMDASKCIASMSSLLANVPGMGGGIPGLNGIPGLDNVAGCAPMDVNRCITALTAAASSGTVPKVDLSACLPTSTSLPTGLPGLAGALSFFGR
jgi:hypothetical protein